MAHYRVYVLDKTGHVDGPPSTFELADDNAAMDKARQLLDGHVLEVWLDARLVSRLHPAEGGDKKSDC